jgi:glyoxylase-like metal-dependent hydrolase (beta-lactamase superfamily II)
VLGADDRDPADGGDMADYLASLERMLDLELARIYPGHGPLIADPKASCASTSTTG